MSYNKIVKLLSKEANNLFKCVPNAFFTFVLIGTGSRSHSVIDPVYIFQLPFHIRAQRLPNTHNVYLT